MVLQKIYNMMDSVGRPAMKFMDNKKNSKRG